MNQVHLAERCKAIRRALTERQYHQAAELAAGMVAVAELDEDLHNCFLGKYLLGVAYYHLHDYQHSIEKYLELNNLILGSDTGVAELGLPTGLLDRVRYGMAADMYRMGDLDGAAVVLGHILESGTDAQVVVNSAILLGVVYLGMYDLYPEPHLLAVTLEMYLTLLEEVNLPRSRQTMLYNNLAILFTYQQEYAKAQEMLNNAFHQVAALDEMISIFHEMSRVHLQQKSLEKVRKNLERAREYLRDAANPEEEARHFLLAGMFKREEEDYPAALRLLERGLSLAKESRHCIGQIQVCRELAIVSERSGIADETEYGREYEHLLEGINPVKEVIVWQPIWNSIAQAHASLNRKRKNGQS